MAFESDIKISFTLTISKFFAFVLLACGVVIDIVAGTKGTVFMFTVPFCTALITGKQGFDALKEKFRNKV